ncbi:peptidyl-prolyl cis-trans isomerase [Lujinxingia vulgaris]|uniref:Peptidyl-prolyl cis-trans isomerase n=1 Tax=Lujinxingia vulgaris TaxID=2600176 RepID=A0A5C6XJC5_9DELT|nr:peptidylprolyl isomerase [Lujinxingia vulgaris]TXD38290.1 peptidyl-prolyl cis-trans isomerase [Lujinxingia vulgaris]
MNVMQIARQTSCRIIPGIAILALATATGCSTNTPSQDADVDVAAPSESVPDEKTQTPSSEERAEEVVDANEDPDRAELHHIYFRLPDGLSTRATGPVATVGGVSVSARAYHEQLDYFAGKPNEDGSHDYAINNALKKVIQRQLLLNAFAPDEEAIEAERARLRLQQEAEVRARRGDDADLAPLRERWENDPTFGRKQAVDNLLIDGAMQRLGQTLPDRGDARDYHQAHPEEFQTQAVVEARVISARDAAEGQPARDYIAELHEQFTAEGADRDALFERHRDPIYGLVSVTEEDARSPDASPLADVAFEQEVDQLSEPFEHRGLWMFVWTHTRHEAGLIPFEKVEELLLERLQFEAREDAWTTMSERLLEQSEVTLHWENLSEPSAPGEER